MSQQRYRQADDRRRHNIETVWLSGLTGSNSHRDINTHQKVVGSRKMAVKATKEQVSVEKEGVSSKKKQQLFLRLRGLVKLELLANKKTTINQLRFIDGLKRYAVFVHERKLKMEFATHSLVQILKQLKCRIDRQWKIGIMAILKEKSRRRYQLLCHFQRIHSDLQESKRKLVFYAFQAIKSAKRYYVHPRNISSMPIIIQCSSMEQNPQLSDKSFCNSISSIKFDQSYELPKTIQSTNEGDWQSVFSTPHKHQKQAQVCYGLRQSKALIINTVCCLQPLYLEKPIKSHTKLKQIMPTKLMALIIDKDVTNSVDFSHLMLNNQPRPLLTQYRSPSKQHNRGHLLYSPRFRESLTTTTAEQYSLDGRSDGGITKRQVKKNKLNSTPAQLYDWLRHNGYERVARRQMERGRVQANSQDIH